MIADALLPGEADVCPSATATKSATSASATSVGVTSAWVSLDVHTTGARHVNSFYSPFFIGEFELKSLSFFERLVSSSFYRGLMNKVIDTVFAFDESIPTWVVKPLASAFHLSRRHSRSLDGILGLNLGVPVVRSIVLFGD